MNIDQGMEPLGEVEILMNMGADNTGGEILKTLLLASKMQKPEEIEVDVLQGVQNQGGEQLVLQIEMAEPCKSQFLPNNENIIQHIPITYLTTNSPNLTPVSNATFVEPVTYVLSRDVLADSRYCTIGRNEPQKLILVQEVDASPTQSAYDSPEAKVFAVKETPSEQCGYSELWDVGRGVGEPCTVSGENCEIIIKTEEKLMENENLEKTEDSLEEVPEKIGKPGAREKSSGSDGKVQRKISSCKKPPNKRKNSKLKSKLKTCGKPLAKKPTKPPEEGKESGLAMRRRNLFELTRLEDNVDQVTERLKIGCECSDWNCFDGLNPDDVFKHRLNIADLTKAEHDMYLMGVIMASIHNLEETCRHKERIRIRSLYAYQGKRVCLTAFLYLQHVTLYQMKRLRSHLKKHGVSPRIHGNRGRKPANTLSLDIYRRATNFVQMYIEKHCVKTVPSFTTFSSNKVVGNNSVAAAQNSKTNAKKEMSVKITNKMTSYHLPPECTKRRVHREYKSFCENLKLSQKVMKYSTFTNFLKKQFPNVKFHKKDEKKHERKQEESEKWKQKEVKSEDPEKQSKVDQGVDKSIQVDKTLTTFIPVKTQIVVDDQLYDKDGGGTETDYGVTDQGLVGTQSYSISQTQNTDQLYALNDTV